MNPSQAPVSVTDLVPSLPRLVAEELLFEATLKSEPEDFVVEEVPAYEPQGEGEHLFLWVQKRDVSPEWLISQLARHFQVRRDEIGTAGLKDRRAVTRQWVSIPADAEALVETFASEEIQILQSVRHRNKLHTGHLRGNQFEITLRHVPDDALQRAEQIIAKLSETGVPNYFGQQRFGIDGETLELGRNLLRGTASPQDIPPKRRKFLTRLALSAAQSSLFNQVLAERMTNGLLHTVQPGDVMQVSASGGLFVVEDPEREQERFDRGETVITGPIFGPKMKSPTGDPLTREQAVLEQSGLTPDVFRTHKKLTPGARRPLLVRPENLTAAAVENGLRVTMTLPSGVYATVVLREFLKNA